MTGHKERYNGRGTCQHHEGLDLISPSRMSRSYGNKIIFHIVLVDRCRHGGGLDVSWLVKMYEQNSFLVTPGYSHSGYPPVKYPRS